MTGALVLLGASIVLFVACSCWLYALRARAQRRERQAFYRVRGESTGNLTEQHLANLRRAVLPSEPGRWAKVDGWMIENVPLYWWVSTCWWWPGASR